MPKDWTRIPRIHGTRVHGHNTYPYKDGTLKPRPELLRSTFYRIPFFGLMVGAVVLAAYSKLCDCNSVFVNPFSNEDPYNKKK